MEDNSDNLELFHYGVKGMKWGITRKKGPGGLVKKSSTPGGLRAAVKKRDEGIKEARAGLTKARKSEGLALAKSAETKVGLVRNRKNPEARENARAASKERKEATANRRAVEKQASKMTSKEMAVKGALYVGPAVAGTASLTAATLATRKNARIGREFAAGKFSDTHGLPRPGTIALQFIDCKWQ